MGKAEGDLATRWRGGFVLGERERNELPQVSKVHRQSQFATGTEWEEEEGGGKAGEGEQARRQKQE